jgi:hypothetical protein
MVLGLSLLFFVCQCVLVEADELGDELYGEVLSASTERIGLWWAMSGWKVRPEMPLPEKRGDSIVIRAARNEAEAGQLVIRPSEDVFGLNITVSALQGAGGAMIEAGNIDLLRVRYVNVTIPTDASSTAGMWPDPLPPLEGPIDIKAGENQAIWIRVTVPRNAKAGVYTAVITLTAEDYSAKVALKLRVYDFTLGDRMTCTTAFGFEPTNVWRYHNLTNEAQKREVLDKYWANFSAHHISPYRPAPLDPIVVQWPDVKAPAGKRSKWENLKVVGNERHGGENAMVIYDDNVKANITVSYKPMIKIPAEGLRLRFWYRSALPGQRFAVTLNHFDGGKWISGHNNDIALTGDGLWQEYDAVIKDFPAGADSVKLMMRSARWTQDGECTGLVWFDDVSISNAVTGQEFIEGGDFEQIVRTSSLLPAEELKPVLDFTAWDKAMERAIDYYHFNSFRQAIPGIGGGTYHSIRQPSLLGFGEDDAEYKIMFDSYCGQLEEHLAAKGWLDEAYVYWFDEPSPDQYGFVMNAFEKLKNACPRIARMLTEQPEPQLVGGPNIYCVISYLYDHEKAERRRKDGDKFWWYVCTGPKAPYCTLFIDHAGTELRVWLWQSWQRNIEGILIWQSNYWTSGVAYPEPGKPQNPYEDPMGWVSGYSTPKGAKRPWGNGDGRFIYPPESAADGNPAVAVLDGPVDSIRWEMLRDGIEDYEYLAMLKKLIEAKKNKLTPAGLQRYSAMLKVPETISSDMKNFTNDPAVIESQRDKIAVAIEELSLF